MTAEAKPRSLWRRIPGELRIAFWLVLLAALVVLLIVMLRDGGGGGDSSASRHTSVHSFSTSDFHSLAYSPAEPGTVFFGHHNGVQMSRDGGETWTQLVQQLDFDAMNLAFDPFAPDTLYAAGHNVFYRSDDSGQTWQEVASNLPGLDIHAFAASPSEAGVFYAYVVGQGLFASEGGVAAWRPLSAGVPHTTFAVHALPGATLLLAAGGDGLLRSNDGGATWDDSGLSAEAVFAVRGDPGGERVYAGTNKGLFVSEDGGGTWRLTGLDDTQVIVIGVSASDSLDVMAVNSYGQLFHSTDGGETWEG